MKTKNTLPFMLASTLFFVACGGKKPVETTESPNTIDTVWLINRANSDQDSYLIARLGNKEGKIYAQKCLVSQDDITACANIGDKLIIERTPESYVTAFKAIRNLNEEKRLKEIIEKNR